eukprot:598641-Heterocapsa_arctica.AAC.1
MPLPGDGRSPSSDLPADVQLQPPGECDKQVTWDWIAPGGERCPGCFLACLRDLASIAALIASGRAGRLAADPCPHLQPGILA